jgi:hypothetical protein
MAFAAAIPVAPTTDHLSDELARLRVAAPSMTPAVLTAVRSVLETILCEEGLDPWVATEARRTLEELFSGSAAPAAPRRRSCLGVRPALRAI